MLGTDEEAQIKMEQFMLHAAIKTQLIKYKQVWEEVFGKTDDVHLCLTKTIEALEDLYAKTKD